MDDQQSMLVQPTSGKDNQLFAISAAGDPVTHQSHQGVALVLPGHYATERFGIEELAGKLAKQFLEMEVWASRRESDPVSWVLTDGRSCNNDNSRREPKRSLMAARVARIPLLA